jgi:hypothetical protein
MLAQALERLAKAADANPEMQPELEALRRLAREIDKGELDIALIVRLGPESFQALLAELVQQKKVQLLLQISGAGLESRQKRLAKKALHRLRSQGVKIPEKASTQKSFVPPATITEWAKITPAILMNGQQLVYYFVSGALGSSLLFGHLDPEQGLLQCSSLRMGESRARTIAEKSSLAGKERVPLVQVPREHMLWLLSLARSKSENAAAINELDKSLTRLKLKLAPDPGAHPLLAALDLENIRSRPGLGFQSDRLLDHPFFKHWQFDEATIKACAADLEQAAHSPLALSEDQLKKRMEDILNKHAGAGLEKNRKRVGFGLFENALLLKIQGEQELAEIAASLALVLEQKEAPPDFFSKILLRDFPEVCKKIQPAPSSLIISGG